MEIHCHLCLAPGNSFFNFQGKKLAFYQISEVPKKNQLYDNAIQLNL